MRRYALVLVLSACAEPQAISDTLPEVKAEAQAIRSPRLPTLHLPGARRITRPDAALLPTSQSALVGHWGVTYPEGSTLETTYNADGSYMQADSGIPFEGSFVATASRLQITEPEFNYTWTSDYYLNGDTLVLEPLRPVTPHDGIVGVWSEQWSMWRRATGQVPSDVQVSTSTFTFSGDGSFSAIFEYTTMTLQTSSGRWRFLRDEGTAKVYELSGSDPDWAQEYTLLDDAVLTAAIMRRL
jgi:hypothetical protein